MPMQSSASWLKKVSWLLYQVKVYQQERLALESKPEVALVQVNSSLKQTQLLASVAEVENVSGSR